MKPLKTEYRQLMNDIALSIDESFNGKGVKRVRRTGFMLLLWPTSMEKDNPRSSFISNSPSKDYLINMLKATLLHLESSK